MTRVKGGTIHRARRKKIMAQAKGYFGSKHRLFKTAQEQVFHSGAYAYRDRKQKKRNFRKLWITRINAACRLNDISYSKFISGLNKAGIEINRKMLSAIAIDDAKAFAELVNVAKAACEGKVVAPKKAAAKVEVTEEKAETNDLSKLTVAELKELALHAVNGTAPANYTAETVDEALRGELKALAGSVNQFMKNRYDIYIQVFTLLNITKILNHQNKTIYLFLLNKFQTMEYICAIVTKT